MLLVLSFDGVAVVEAVDGILNKNILKWSHICKQTLLQYANKS